jgi:hypothetical protein
MSKSDNALNFVANTVTTLNFSAQPLSPSIISNPNPSEAQIISIISL